MYKNNFSEISLKDLDIIFLTLTRDFKGNPKSPFQIPALT